jgi:hypothetical protein
MEDMRGTYGLSMGRSDGKWPLEKPRRRWENNIKVDLQEVGWRGMVWVEPAQHMHRWRFLASAVMNLLFPQNAGNLLTS